MIRVERNAAGNCLVFKGQTNPVYFNACLSAEEDPNVPGTINVKNDIASSVDADSDNFVYEYYQIPFAEWEDGDGNFFESAQAVVDYINGIGNVTDVPTGGYSFGPEDALDFTRDETNTSILFSNGDHHGINAVKAVAKDNGRVGLVSAVGDFEFYELDHTTCTIGGNSAGNTLNSVVNALNAFFTLSLVGDGVDPAPVFTLEDGEDVTLNFGNEATNLGGGLVGSTVASPGQHGCHVWTDETINEPGEYFDFQVKGGESQIGFGLYDAGSNDLTELASSSGNGHSGFRFSVWFHPTPNGPWTVYGSHTSLVYGPGWNGSNRFAVSPAYDDWAGNEYIRIKVGIDENNFPAVYYYDIDRTNDWIKIARSGIPLPDGEYGLAIKCGDSNGRIYTVQDANGIKRYATDAAAPTLYYRYIESPDGVWHYPLFATEEEANHADTLAGGSGTSHTHTYIDDPSGTTWYMPDTGGTENGTSAPLDGGGITYTGITTLPDGQFAPSTFTQTDLTIQEGTAVNIQVTPAGASWTSTVSGLPAGLVYDGYSLIQGTAPEVSSDTDYTISVTRANSYGSSTGSFTLTITDSAPVQTNDTSWSKALDFSGNAERAMPVSSSPTYVPMKMAGQASQVSDPPSGQTVTNGHPWATACVFKIDGNNSNQHIWNLGEGSGTNDDNIYLRVSSDQRLYFGWGRQGALNECLIHTLSSAWWYGIYVGFNGARYGAAGSTAGRLDSIFDIRLISSIDNFGSLSVPATDLMTGWTHGASSTGGRMDREFNGDLTIGGRGSNRSFHGKVASFVSTTLRNGVAMPTDAEITEMITDPIGWMDDYKKNQPFRFSNSTGDFGSNWATGDVWSRASTQVYLMGDGIQDSYSNMIRNQVWSGDQNATKLNMISMVSNDIQTVNIPGLT